MDNDVADVADFPTRNAIRYCVPYWYSSFGVFHVICIGGFLVCGCHVSTRMGSGKGDTLKRGHQTTVAFRRIMSDHRIEDEKPMISFDFLAESFNIPSRHGKVVV